MILSKRHFIVNELHAMNHTFSKYVCLLVLIGLIGITVKPSFATQSTSKFKKELTVPRPDSTKAQIYESLDNISEAAAFHLDDSQAFMELAHVYHTVRFPHDAVLFLAEPDLPPGWNDRPENPSSQLVGSAWLDSRLSPVMAVPSVLIPAGERYRLENMNFLINPAHPATADAIQVGPINPIELDARLVK